jgi:hypothetical protein
MIIAIDVTHNILQNYILHSYKEIYDVDFILILK